MTRNGLHRRDGGDDGDGGRALRRLAVVVVLVAGIVGHGVGRSAAGSLPAVALPGGVLLSPTPLLVAVVAMLAALVVLGAVIAAARLSAGSEPP